MTNRYGTALLVLTFAFAGCGDLPTTAPEAPDGPLAVDPGAATAAAGGVQASATGGGFFTVAGVLEVQFSMSAVQTDADGSATGRAHHSVDFQGELVEFHTEVTCATFDEAEGRAWIGGVITQNNSTHSAFTGETQEVGDAIWFRVLDNGQGAAAAADRSTFVGFEGNAGIITSQEYCDARIWPENDARTSPVTEGNIQVRVR